MLVDYGKGALPTLEFSDLELERAETSEGPGGAVEEVAGPDANVEVARADVAVVELEEGAWGVEEPRQLKRPSRSICGGIESRHPKGAARRARARRRVPTLSPDGAPHSRPSRAGHVGDAGAGLGEGLEPVCFDASPELG
jgi:hypothetical protein